MRQSEACSSPTGRRAKSRGWSVQRNAVGVGDAPGGSALDLPLRSSTILVGHAGSGKTEIAINLALGLRQGGAAVTLVDLDLVKPYFRCRLAKDELEARGIRLVAPGGDRFYSDLPILVPEARAAGRDGKDGRVIYDVGGSDLGARVLGSFGDLLDPVSTDLLFVVNGRRPFAEDLASRRAMLLDVQAAARMPVTGLVANTHLMQETTVEIVMAGICAARELAAATGIPLRFCAMLAGLVRGVSGSGGEADGLPILPLERYIVAPFMPPPPGVPRRPSVV